MTNLTNNALHLHGNVIGLMIEFNHNRSCITIVMRLYLVRIALYLLTPSPDLFSPFQVSDTMADHDELEPLQDDAPVDEKVGKGKAKAKAKPDPKGKAKAKADPKGKAKAKAAPKGKAKAKSSPKGAAKAKAARKRKAARANTAASHDDDDEEEEEENDGEAGKQEVKKKPSKKPTLKDKISTWAGGVGAAEEAVSESEVEEPVSTEKLECCFSVLHLFIHIIT